jgi:hypothetical protein
MKICIILTALFSFNASAIFDLEGNKVDDDINPYAQRGIAVSCQIKRLTLYMSTEVKIVDAVGSIENPKCRDLEKGAIEKICYRLLKEEIGISECKP